MTPYFLTCFALILFFFIRGLITGHFRAVLYYSVAMLIGSGSSHTCLFLSHLPNIGAIWFFPALLVCKTVYNCLSRFCIEKRMLLALIICLAATLIGRYVIFIPFSVLSGLSAIIFYAIGDLYQKKKPKVTWIHWTIGMICWFISFKHSHVYMVQPQMDLYIIDVIGATTATFLIYNIAVFIQKYLKATITSWIGRNSMYILCFHLMDLNIGISYKLTASMHEGFTILSMLLVPLVCTLLFVLLKSYISSHFISTSNVNL